MRLTPRQRLVVLGISEGLTCRQIALRLGISKRTVERHIENIATKLPGNQPPIRRILQHVTTLIAA